MSGSLADARNLGPRTAMWLEEIGITSLAQIRTLGAAATYEKLKAAHPREINRTALWSLAGAVLDMPYTALPAEVKNDLLAELAALERE